MANFVHGAEINVVDCLRRPKSLELHPSTVMRLPRQEIGPSELIMVAGFLSITDGKQDLFEDVSGTEVRAHGIYATLPYLLVLICKVSLLFSALYAK